MQFHRGDIVESLGKFEKVVSIYIHKRTNKQFVHLSNGQRNIKSEILELSKIQQIPKEDKMKIKQLTSQELESLTKSEINTSIGGKYSASELKKKSKEVLIKEYLQSTAPKTTRNNSAGYASRGSLFHMRSVLEQGKFNTISSIAESYISENPDKQLKKVIKHFKTNLKGFKNNGFKFETKFEDNKEIETEYKIAESSDENL